jgi:hypothetical protein
MLLKLTLRLSNSAPPRSRAARYATVDHQFRSRHVAGHVGGEEAQPICDILRLPALPNGTPGFGHFVRIDRRIAPDGRRRLCQIAVSMTPRMDRADPDAIA